MLDQRKADTRVERKKAASGTGSKTRKNQLGPACVSTACFHVWRKEPALLLGHEAGIHLAFCVERSRVPWCSPQQPGEVTLRLGNLCFQRGREGPSRYAAVSQKWRVHQSNEQRKKLVFLDRFSVIFTGPPAPDELLSFWKTGYEIDC